MHDIHSEVSKEYLKWERSGEKHGLQSEAVFSRNKDPQISISTEQAHGIAWHQSAIELEPGL